MSEILIRAEHLGVRLGGSTLLENISLAIAPGEFVVVAGPNGSGKTTLLRALLGLEAASGRLRRKDGLRLGYVPQSQRRDPALPLTARRFLSLFAPAPADAADAARQLRIEPLLESPLHSLSGGEMARVQLARAILRRPELLVLDEPFAAVDAAGQAELFGLLAALRQSLPCTLLLVSHDLDSAFARASRVICLNRQIRCDGPPAQIVREPAFVELFGRHLAGHLAADLQGHDHG